MPWNPQPAHVVTTHHQNYLVVSSLQVVIVYLDRIIVLSNNAEEQRDKLQDILYML